MAEKLSTWINKFLYEQDLRNKWPTKDAPVRAIKDQTRATQIPRMIDKYIDPSISTKAKNWPVRHSTSAMKLPGVVKKMPGISTQLALMLGYGAGKFLDKRYNVSDKLAEYLRPGPEGESMYERRSIPYRDVPGDIYNPMKGQGDYEVYEGETELTPEDELLYQLSRMSKKEKKQFDRFMKKIQK